MRSPRVLIVYGTKHGQTEKVARYLADVLTAVGTTTTVVDADSPASGIALRDFDGVIVGSPVMYGRHRRSVGRFVRANREALDATASAFFSVSGSAASPLESERAQARRCADEFLRNTGWHPALTALVGGAMAYTKYSPLMRWMVRRAARRAGGPLDTSRDHELTDWTRVRRFAESFAAMVPARGASPAAMTV